MLIDFAHSPESARQFFNGVAQDWLSSLQAFVQHDLPRLIVLLIFAWALIPMVNVLTRRLTAIAETRATKGVVRASQIKTLASVMRATTDRRHRIYRLLTNPSRRSPTSTLRRC